MADQPILVFPAAVKAERESLSPSHGAPIKTPGKGKQGKRLTARWEGLVAAFGTVHTDTSGLDSEQIIVLEIAGSIEAFQNTVRKTAGMEWLGDFDATIDEPAPGFLLDGSQPNSPNARLFVMASSFSAMQKLLSIWKIWINADKSKLSRPLRPFATVFKHLHDVRRWNAKDRVRDTGVVAYWEQGLFAKMPTIRFEVELWCRTDASDRAASYEELERLVSASDGKCLTRATLPEIDYDGVIVELPASEVVRVLEELNRDDGKTIVHLQEIKYFTPLGQAAITPLEMGTPSPSQTRPLPTDPPLIALLDGLPLANHEGLQNRLIVDDPDDYASEYHANEHRHGTAMASLIAHGEYDSTEEPLRSKIYVRPVMRPGDPDASGRREERFLADRLPIDTIHRAVRRIFEDEGTQKATAPTVKIINLSIGDPTRLFDRQVSAWARLLDWLSWKYRVLFVVSAGNHFHNITLPVAPASISTLSEEELVALTLKSLSSQRLQRRLLSPAESLNSLTVGSLHSQVSPDGNAGPLVDLLPGPSLPSPVSCIANGFRRAIKPEILVPGGRRRYSLRLASPSTGSSEFELIPALSQPGQLVAAPGGVGFPNTGTVRCCGSSNAAALASRHAAIFADRIRELRTEPGGNVLDDAHMAVILRAMLIHGASWGNFKELYYKTFVDPSRGRRDWQKVERDCARFIGYGPADFDRASICSDQRVILIGAGDLLPDQGHRYSIPLPPALSAVSVGRRLTITLAWLTPINPRHRNYGIADLWFRSPTSELRLQRGDAGDRLVKQGTVQHEVLEGDDIVAITEGDSMPIQVNCRHDAGAAADTPTPYALLVSLEVAKPLAVSIYDQMKVAIDNLRTPIAIKSKSAPT